VIGRVGDTLCSHPHGYGSHLNKAPVLTHADIVFHGWQVAMKHSYGCCVLEVAILRPLLPWRNVIQSCILAEQSRSQPGRRLGAHLNANETGGEEGELRPLSATGDNRGRVGVGVQQLAEVDRPPSLLAGIHQFAHRRGRVLSEHLGSGVVAREPSLAGNHRQTWKGRERKRRN